MVTPRRGDPPQVTQTTCFSVQAAADPSVVPAVVGVFAKQGLVPSRLYGARHGPGNAEMHIDIQVTGIGRAACEGLARNLRRIVCVESVLTTEQVRAEVA